MHVFGWIGLAVLAAAPVEVTLLNGEQKSGSLQKLTAKELSLQPENGPAAVISTADLLEVRVTGERPKPAAADPAVVPVRVDLVDGSQLQLTEVKTTSKELQGQHGLLGEIRMPLSAVRSLRFTPAEAKLDPLWAQLLEKGSKEDMIVVQKTAVLDHLDGVVGSIDDASVKFLLDGDEITVKREKAFGVIYARKPSNAKLAARAELANGDFVSVKALTGDGQEWKVDSLIGPSWTIPAAALVSADFSLGKVVYLSALEPRSMTYTPWYEDPAGTIRYGEYRRDRNIDGRPLRVYGKTYSRGLAIHSKTELVYRLGSDYRRFQAMMGVDDEITNPQWGHVSVRILGDRKELYSGVCKPREAPVALDLDVQGVVELEIIVDYGPDKVGIGDRLHLADARIVK